LAGKECATLGTNFSWVKSKLMTAHTQFVPRRWHAIQSFSFAYNHSTHLGYRAIIQCRASVGIHNKEFLEV
jgi:hypothetical protein